MKLIRLRRRLLAAQIVREFRGLDDKELIKLKRKLTRPIVEEQIRQKREEKLKEIKMHRRTEEDLLSKREQLHEEYLKADREDKQEKALVLQSQIRTLDWVMGRAEDV